ncbi:MAG: ATP synthase F0 subunit C [Capsulimonadaceae bacterium]
MASIYFGLVALGMALMLPLAAIGCGIGEGLIFASVIQGIARQPEATAAIDQKMYITFALVEALFIITLVFFFIMSSHLPTPTQVNALLAK